MNRMRHYLGDIMELPRLTIDEYEETLESFDLKFPRRFGAENKKLPPMRMVFERSLEELGGHPPNPTLFAQNVWDGCENISADLEDDVKARARRAHPTFCREIHLWLLLQQAFQDSAEVHYGAELDMKNKTDFLISSPVEPISIRLHTHTDTRRGNYYAKKQRKVSSKNMSADILKGAAGLPENTHEAVEIDFRITLNKDTCHNLKNGFWLYSANHIAKVVDLYEQLHSTHA
jgi:hypothetical protein